MISVIIPIFNRAKIFRKSLDSLLKQKFQDFEVIVVDDGSTEDIKTVFEEYKEKLNIKYFWQKNNGAPSARNFGLSKASGEFVIFFDADIVAFPDFLFKMQKILKENPEIDFVYSNYFFSYKKMFAKEFSLEELKNNNFIHSSALIRRAKALNWDEKLKKFQDWDYFLTLAKENYHGFFLNEFLYKIKSGGSMSFWMPSCAYKKPFKFIFPFSKNIKRYEEARKIILEKHHLK